MLRKPEQFRQEGSKVFRKAPVNTVSIEGWVKISGGKAADAARKANSASTRLGAGYDTVSNLMRNNQYQGIEPSAQDVEYALDVMNRVVPRLLGYLNA
ncbi:hypothetical protein [Ramlibacter montanisoli]|uniref:Uncharacterized protein n=1 Tax=Ramlibacter montanisoli TaxID=2732512 RepID=A0A849K8R2_9BURK|nr:hypothetical protein [Ramlibacter montanisoli]NNU44762.1 hypothetical protein [Ramlibacter montanisoli]